MSSFYFQAIKTNYDVFHDVSIFTFASKEIWADAYEEATLQILNFIFTMSNIEFAI